MGDHEHADGSARSFTTTIGGAASTKTISGLTMAEQVADAWGAAGTLNNTFCIDIASGNAVFLASPTLTVTGSGLATDLLQSIVVPDNTGPGGASSASVDHHRQQPGERAVVADAQQPADPDRRQLGWFGAGDPHGLR